MTLSSQVALVVERFFFRYRGLLIWVHAAMFLFFIAVLAIPPLLDEPGEFDNLFTHFTLFSNYMMWGIWFPLVFISVIVTGRSWCGILCPMGAAAEWGNFRG
ncbi:MAG: 4Fe-4S binding protein, partial [Arenicellales bacterium]|nr:4Fe-4S binding protein [Arenicellales bacterium]